MYGNDDDGSVPASQNRLTFMFPHVEHQVAHFSHVNGLDQTSYDFPHACPQ